MKVFLSWSGDKSQRVAQEFSSWAPLVLQAVKPWISSRDIDRGSIWFTEITEQLKDTNFGVLFVTRENQAKPWLLFEAGALSKGLADNRVCTVLVDLAVSEIEAGSPFQQLNHTKIDRDGTLRLIKTMNKKLASNDVQENMLEKTFDALWPSFEEKVEEALRLAPPHAAEDRKEKDILNDILEIVLTLNRRLPTQSVSREPRYILPQHARLLIERLSETNLERDEIIEITETLIPPGWLRYRLREHEQFHGDSDDVELTEDNA